MILINTMGVYGEINEYCLGLTRIAYTPKLILLDIAEKIFLEKPMDAMEPIRHLYQHKHRFRTEDYVTDKKALESLYEEIPNKLRVVLKDYLPNGQSFDCAISCKGGQLVLLTLAEIKKWESIYGSKDLIIPEYLRVPE